MEAFFMALWNLFSEMAPYLILGFFLAGVLHVWIPSSLYINKISKPTFMSAFWASVFGVPLPICSCGVIPTAIALRREGASKGASMAFMVSTPATGVDSILATYSLLGLPFAIIRPIAAFATSLLAGAVTNFATKSEKDIPLEMKDDDCCKVKPHGVKNKLYETFDYGFGEILGSVAKWLVVGLVLGALISAFVPDDLFIRFREYPLLCMIAVLIVAMPMYTCAMGSIPLAVALIEKGLTPGAAFVLLMAGPATSIASMTVVGKNFGKRALIAYLSSIAVGAIGFGLLIDYFWMNSFISAIPMMGKTMDIPQKGIVYTLSAVVLAVLFIRELIPWKIFKKSKSITKDEIMKTYNVIGMSCEHCKRSVENAVKEIPGVTKAEVSLHDKSVQVEGNASEELVRKAVEKTGFVFGGEKK
ncbi:MAG: permease [Fibrobacteraceae bacterium]